MSDKFKAKLEKLGSNVWNTCFFLPEKIKVKYLVGEKRVICKLNNKVEMHAGLMPAGEGLYFINVNKEIRKKLDLNIGDDISIAIDFDKSKYGMPIPEEMDELLKIDDEASKYFHKLTRGKQRTLLYMISKPKSSDGRLKKALVITEFLKTYKGKLDYKSLNEAFKNYDN